MFRNEDPDMSTNSRIGILIPSSDPTSSIDSATIRSVYCHWDGYPSHMGLTLHRNYGTGDLVNELLDKGAARLIEKNGESQHYMHSQGGHKADTMTVDHFIRHYLEQYNYIGMPQEDGTVEWIVCTPPENPRITVQWKLVINELIEGTGTFPQLSTKEKQILYMDLHRVERINPSVIGTMYQACVQSLHNAHGTNMKRLGKYINERNAERVKDVV